MQQSGPMRLVAILAVLVVIVSAALIMLRPVSEKPQIGDGEEAAPRALTYQSDAYKISFTYPDGYVLSEHDFGNQAERGHHTVSLIRASEAAAVPKDGEGPTSITLDLYDNAIDRLSLEKWVKNTASSNFKLAVDQTLATSTLAGAPALRYTWDGLYRGDSVVAASGTRIYMFSVTYMDSAAPIRDDFETLLSTVELR